MKNKDISTYKKYIFVIILSLTAVLSILFFAMVKLEEKVKNDIFLISTTDILSIANNNANKIEAKLEGKDNFLEELKKNENLKNEIEKNLELLITNNIKYVYILYKDKNDILRFLIDASKNKAFMHQKFDIENNKWIEAFQNKQELLIKQDILHKLSFTYIKPIVNKNKEVQFILAIDFSREKLEETGNIISYLKISIILVILLLLSFLGILVYQSIKFLKVKNKIYLDKLTTLNNRNYLYDLQKSIDLNNYILAALDIDYFKKINDTYGHDIGDKVLKDISQVFLKSIREKDDYIIRYGGEEFVVLLKKLKDNPDIIKQTHALERILKNVRETKFYVSKDNYINVTISIGVNFNPHKSRNFEDAFKLADKALYDVKNSGRDNIKIYAE